MPFRPGVDDDEPLKNLVDLWEQADVELAARRNTVLSRIDRLLQSADAVDAVDRLLIERRLRLQVRRLDELAETRRLKIARTQNPY